MSGFESTKRSESSNYAHADLIKKAVQSLELLTARLAYPWRSVFYQLITPHGQRALLKRSGTDYANIMFFCRGEYLITCLLPEQAVIESGLDNIKHTGIDDLCHLMGRCTANTVST